MTFMVPNVLSGEVDFTRSLLSVLRHSPHKKRVAFASSATDVLYTEPGNEHEVVPVGRICWTVLGNSYAFSFMF